MPSSSCIVTGGAGFIGCAISAGLCDRFSHVLVVDKLHPQVHARQVRPEALDQRVDFRHADILVPETWDTILGEVRPDVVIHLAAETGTGQSLTEASRHARENVVGTTEMTDAFSRIDHVPERIVLSSSRAIYGEGQWRRADGSTFYPGQRSRQQLAEARWDFAEAQYVPAAATRTEPRPTSVYGATKLAQEHVLGAWCTAFGSTLTIRRLQNVYGPGQSLINSYTGIVSLFARLAREGKSIPLYEDGRMLRDFVFIDDVATAILASLESPAEDVALDVGTGQATSIAQVAEYMAERYGAPAPHQSGQYRFGDVRHAACDIAPTLNALDWRPHWDLHKGLGALCTWIDAQLTAVPGRG